MSSLCELLQEEPGAPARRGAARGGEEGGELARGLGRMEDHHGERGTSSLASTLSTSRPHGIPASSLIQVHLSASEANSRCLAAHPTPPCAGNKTALAGDPQHARCCGISFMFVPSFNPWSTQKAEDPSSHFTDEQTEVWRGCTHLIIGGHHQSHARAYGFPEPSLRDALHCIPQEG